MNKVQDLYNISLDNMVNMMSALAMGVHVKCATTGKFLTGNQADLEIYKFENLNEIIGSTINELDVYMRPYWGDVFAQKVKEMDKYVASTGKYACDKHRVHLDKAGYVHYQNIFKMPFASHSNSKKIVAILTNSEDYTNKVDLITLLDSYLILYASKPRALAMFMNYLGLSEYFYEPLTEKEIICLLHAKDDAVRKNMADNIGVSVKTIEAHISNIKSKLLTGNIESVVKHLRAAR